VTELAANVGGAGLGLALAFHGAGVWSLAAQTVTIFGVRAVLVNCAAFERPKFEFDLGMLRSHLTTGGFVVGARSCDLVGRMFENIIFGAGLGTASLGIYTFANQVPRFVCESAGNICWDILYVQGLRIHPDQTTQLHLQLCRILSIALFPMAFLMSASSQELISIFLGPKWTAAGPLLSILLPIYVLSSIAMQSGAILLKLGRFDIQFFCFAGLSAGRVLAVCAGPWVGVLGVVICIALVNLVYIVAMLIIPSRVTGCAPAAVIRMIAAPLCASVTAGVVCSLILHRSNGHLLSIAIAWLAGLICYFLALFVLDRNGLTGDMSRMRRLILNRSG
jgi:PST family polysaccharide transporter